MSKKILTEKDLNDIEAAARKAEKKTAGEIATAFIKESDDYAIYELFFALICGFFYFNIILLFWGDFNNILSNMLWNYSEVYLLFFYGFSTFLVIGVFYFIANISVIDRLIVPKKVREKKVSERALRHFIEAGVYKTRDRTGILIFISFLEKRVELIADEGINAKIDQDKWDEIVSYIIKGIKKGTLSKNLVSAIADCGDLLAKHFPIKPDDKNELPDAVAVLEK